VKREREEKKEEEERDEAGKHETGTMRRHVMEQVGTGHTVSGASLDARGVVGRLLTWIQPRTRSEARLAVLDRVTLAPRQSLALIEAEGRRLLVATSPDAAPTFYALDGPTPVDSCAARTSC
jgi:hypothetical protein